MFLGFITWDPDNILFRLPWVGFPVTWYGVLFAGGFWIGFQIFISIFARFLALYPQFREGDVHWNQLTRGEELAKIKKGSIASCNELLDREGKEPSGACLRIIKYAEKRVNETGLRRLKKRLWLEEKYPKLFAPIRERARSFAEKLVLYVMVATVLGARLGHVIFYEDFFWYLQNPILILKTWEGGLASHGAVAGIIASIWIFHRRWKKEYPECGFWHLLDACALPALVAGCAIRIGNFFNQEILGTVTNLPWAIVFGHPMDGGAALPRHPAQLYEAIFYGLFFFVLFSLWQKKPMRPGKIAGLMIMGTFIFRFLIEYIKEGQSVWYDAPDGFLLMGQLLSIPMILIGILIYTLPKERGLYSAPDRKGLKG